LAKFGPHTKPKWVSKIKIFYMSNSAKFIVVQINDEKISMKVCMVH
jgi:hypothetical protein